MQYIQFFLYIKGFINKLYYFNIIMINNSNTNSKKENNENENNTHIGFPQNLYEFLKEKKNY